MMMYRLLVALCAGVFLVGSSHAQVKADAGADIAASTGERVRLDGAGSVHEDGDAMTYSWSVVSAPVSVSLSDPVLVRPKFQVQTPGDYVFELTVADQEGATSVDRVTVSTGNLVPVAHAGIDQAGAVGERLRLNGAGSTDANGDALSYAWRLLDQPEGSTTSLSAEAAVRPDILIDVAGEYTFQLVVTDAQGETSDPAQLLVSTQNTTPVAEAGPNRIARLGQTVLFDPDGTIDPDGDALTASWAIVSRPAGSTVDLVEDADGRFGLTPDLNGDYVVQLSVSDGELTSLDTAVLSVGPEASVGSSAGLAPEIAYTLGASIELSAARSVDLDGSPFSARWALLSRPAGSLAELEANDQIETRLTPDAAGDYVVQLAVSDGMNAPSLVTSVLTASALAPRADAGADGLIVEQAAFVDGTGSEGNLLDFMWSVLGLSSGSEGGVADAPNSAVTPVSFPRETGGVLSGPKVEAALDLLNQYNVLVLNRLNTRANISGRTFVGGHLVGGATNYGAGLGDASGSDVLKVGGSLFGGRKIIHSGGDVRVGGRAKTYVRFTDGGELTQGAAFSIAHERAALKGLSSELAQLRANSQLVVIPSRRFGAVKFVASPDENGVAVFNIPDGRLLFNNWKIRKIKFELNGASTVIVNVGGRYIPLSQAYFIGAIRQSDVSQRVLWNFPDAVGLDFYNDFQGTILAPWAYLENRGRIKGGVFVRSLSTRASIHLPTFGGDGLVDRGEGTQTLFALVQLAVNEAGNFLQSFDTAVLTAGNVRPVAIAGPDVDTGLNETLILDGTASSDLNGDALTYSWSLVSAPEGSQAQISDPFSPAPVLEPDQRGVYLAQLIVSDGRLDARPVTIGIRVLNSPPVADAGPDLTAFVGEQIILDSAASTDPDGDRLTFEWSLVSAPEGAQAVLVGATSDVASFAPDQRGTYVFELVASDGAALSQADQVTLTVPNRLPVAALNVAGDEILGGLIMADSSGSADPDGDALTYIWSVFGPDGVEVSLSDSGAPVIDFAPELPGLYIITLIVSDGQDVSVAVTASVEIIDGNRAPVFDPVTDVTLAAGLVAEIQLSASDADGDALTYAISPLPLPTGSSFNAQTGRLRYQTSGADIGPVLLTASVSDGFDVVSTPVSIMVTNDALGGVAEIRGQVLNAADFQQGIETPIAGAVVSLDGSSVLTGVDGGFSVQPTVFGARSLQVRADGFVSALRDVDTFEGVATILPSPVLLSPVGGGEETVVPGQETMVVDPATGAMLIIAADTATRLNGDPFTGDVSLTNLSPGQVAGLPFGFAPCQFFAIQPEGVRFSPPAQIKAPNPDNLPAGTLVDLWELDLGTGRLQIVGVGEVTADASFIETISGGVRGDRLVAMAPRVGALEFSDQQPTTTATPSLLGEGTLSTSLNLPAYLSVDANRAPAFIYTSTSGTPRPIVAARLERDPAGAASSVTASVQIGGVELQSFEVSLLQGAGGEGVLAVGESLELTAQFDARSYQTGALGVEFIAINRFACSTVPSDTTGRVLIDNQTDSSFGSGWSQAEVSRLIPEEDGSVSIREGNGVLKNFQPETPVDFEGVDPLLLPVDGPVTGTSADYDLDGDTDILWVEGRQGRIVFFRNDEDRTFVRDFELFVSDSVDVPPNAEFPPNAFTIKTGDFNGDGFPDLAVANQFDGDFRIAFNDGGGRYDAFDTIIPASSGLFAVPEISTGDFDADGIDDVLVWSDRMFYRGTPEGLADGVEFEGSTVGSGAQEALEADFNGDGILDGFQRGRNNNLIILGRAGDVPRIQSFSGPGGLRLLNKVAGLLDFDRDGLLEAVIVSNQNDDELRFFDIDEEGNIDDLPLLVPEVVGGSLSALVVTDLTGDGIDDLVGVREVSFVVYPVLPDGGFDTPVVIDLIGAAGVQLIATDFDGDGFLDLVTRNSDAEALSVYFGQAADGGEFIRALSDFTDLTLNEDGTYGRRFKNGTVISYNAAGLQTSIVDSNGRVTEYAYNSDDQLISITDPAGLVTRYAYGSDGRMESLTYPDGRVTEYEHDPRGNLVSYTNPEGEVIRFGYGDDGLLNMRTDRRGNETSHSYDEFGRYSGSVLADGTEIALDLARTVGLEGLGAPSPRQYVPESQRITRLTDGRGGMTRTQVNQFGAPLVMTDPIGRTTVYERDENNLATAIDAPSSVTITSIPNPLAAGARFDVSGRLRTEFTYDSQGNVLSMTEAVGTDLERVTTYEYEPVFSKLVRMTDPDGFVTTYEYDDQANMTRQTNADGGVMTYTYDAIGLKLSETDTRGNLYTYLYDARGRMERSFDPRDTVTLYEYDELGNIIRMVEDEGGALERVSTYTYDDQNRRLSSTNPENETMLYAYDDYDNLIRTEDATQVVETREYDERNRLVAVNDPATGRQIYTYNGENDLLSRTDANGDVSFFEYDLVGRMIQSTDARGQLRDFVYDARDNIVSVTDARRNTTVFEYDVLDRPVARTNPVENRWAFAYDLRDNRTSTFKADGEEIVSTYDELSRMTRIFSDSVFDTFDRRYVYDTQSNLLEVRTGNTVTGSILSFTYDNFNRVETATRANNPGTSFATNFTATFTYTYDDLERRTAMLQEIVDRSGEPLGPQGLSTYAYDSADRLLSLTTPGGELYDFTYDDASRMTSRIAPSAANQELTYDNGGRIDTYLQSTAIATINAYDYAYTNRGNLSEIAETGRTRAYTYDELERLTEVEVPVGANDNSPASSPESYTLDPEGNRLTSHTSSAHVTDAANRLLEDDRYTYTWDVNGNLVAKTAKDSSVDPDWSYDYTIVDELAEVRRDGSRVVQYRYDALGRRDANGPGARTYLVFDGPDRVIDVFTENAITGPLYQERRYIHGAYTDQPVAMETFVEGSTAPVRELSFHADHLGSIRFLTDEAGQVVNEYDYDAYGRPEIISESFAQPFLYTAREWEPAAELYHYRARAYDPDTGRFFQEDPIHFNGGDLNIHRYVGNNPLNYFDPSGLTASSETAASALQAGKSAPVLQRIGFAVECVFGSIAAASFLVNDANKRGITLERLAVNKNDCSAVGKGSRTIRAARAALRRAVCTKATPQTAARKGRLVEELAEVIITETTNILLDSQVRFDSKSDTLIADRTIRNQRDKRIEIKGGKGKNSVRLPGKQRNKYASRAGQTLVLQFVCKRKK